MFLFQPRFKLIIIFIALLMGACREDDELVMPVVTDAGQPLLTDIAGMYVLCEGNMGSNKATLDYLDLTTGQYQKNIFPSRNPNQVMALGDVGNDVKVYGSKLWLVINCSNKVEVCRANDAVSVGHVDVPNCRYLAFHNGYAYVSAYVGRNTRQWDRLGAVFKIDTLSLAVVDELEVGYQPEEMTIVGDMLYVANSGGYKGATGRGYDDRITEIDLTDFTLKRHIPLAPNLFRLRADRYGQLWATTRETNEKDHPSMLYLLNDRGMGMEPVDSFDIAVTDMAMRGDSLCYYASTFDEQWQQHHTTGVLSMRTRKPIGGPLFQEPADMPVRTAYGLMVHPHTGHVFLMDATNYVSSGWLYSFDDKGIFQWRVSTGDIPGHAVFVDRTLMNNSNHELNE